MVVNYWFELEIGQILTVQDMINLENRGLKHLPDGPEGQTRMWDSGVLITLVVLSSDPALIWKVVNVEIIGGGQI